MLVLDDAVQMAPFRLAPGLMVVAFLPGNVESRAEVVAREHFGDHLLQERIGLAGGSMLQRLVGNRRNLALRPVPLGPRRRQGFLGGGGSLLNLRTVLSQLRPELAAADHLIAGHLEHLEDSRPVVLYDTRLDRFARRPRRRSAGTQPQAPGASMLVLDDAVQMAPFRLAPSLVVVAFLVGSSVLAMVVAVAYFGHHLLEKRSGFVGDNLFQRLVGNHRNLWFIRAGRRPWQSSVGRVSRTLDLGSTPRQTFPEVAAQDLVARRQDDLSKPRQVALQHPRQDRRPRGNQMLLLRGEARGAVVAFRVGRVVVSPAGVALAQLRHHRLEERVVVVLHQLVEQLVGDGGNTVAGSVRPRLCRRYRGLDDVGRFPDPIDELIFHAPDNLVQQAGRQLRPRPPVRSKGLARRRIQRAAGGVLVVTGILEDGLLSAHERFGRLQRRADLLQRDLIPRSAKHAAVVGTILGILEHRLQVLQQTVRFRLVESPVDDRPRRPAGAADRRDQGRQPRGVELPPGIRQRFETSHTALGRTLPLLFLLPLAHRRFRMPAQRRLDRGVEVGHGEAVPTLRKSRTVAGDVDRIR